MYDLDTKELLDSISKLQLDIKMRETEKMKIATHYEDLVKQIKAQIDDQAKEFEKAKGVYIAENHNLSDSITELQNTVSELKSKAISESAEFHHMKDQAAVLVFKMLT